MILAALQKQQASESPQRTKLMEEPECQTGTLCRSFAAVRSQRERCRNEVDRVKAYLGRLEKIQIKGVVFLGSSRIIIILCWCKA